MGRWQADEQKRTALREHLLAKRLMAVQIVAQQGRAPGRDPRPPLLEPTGGCSEFTVLFRVPVLRTDERRRQREHRPLVRGRRSPGSRRHDRYWVWPLLSVRVEHCAQWIAHEQWYSVPSSAINRRPSAWRWVSKARCCRKASTTSMNTGARCSGAIGIEQVADLLGARNLVHAEQRTGIVASALFLHAPLIIEK